MMRQVLHSLVGALAAVATLFAVARAETWTLQSKRLEPENRMGAPSPDNIYRMVQGQHFHVQFNAEGKAGVFPGDRKQAAAFQRIVKKEPQYQSAFPFRGVAKLGAQEYAFALDAVSPSAAPGGGKPLQAKPEMPNNAPPADSPAAKISDWLRKAILPAERPTLDGLNYNRLYFDFNGNGDLTDDKVVEANPPRFPAQNMPGGQSYAQFEFPQLDLPIEVAGVKFDYAFSMRGQAAVGPKFAYTGIQLGAAAYREGEITLEGKKHRVALIDFNSNGRFDDQIEVRKDARSYDGRIYPQQGDVLLVDPDPAGSTAELPFEITTSNARNHVSKLIAVDGRFYDLKISPAGDKLTLTPSSLPLGKVVDPKQDLHAEIYGELGFLKIRGGKGQPIAVPAGRWNLLSYSLDRSSAAEPAPPPQQADTWLGNLAQKAGALLGGMPPRQRLSVLMVSATVNCKEFAVGDGQTVELPLGPPYKPVVKVLPFGPRRPKRVDLELSLVGSAGEACSFLIDYGRQPAKPTFLITDADGDIVQDGAFEFYSSFPCRYSWQTPDETSREYHVRVGMKGIPIPIEEKNDSVVHLQPPAPKK